MYKIFLSKIRDGWIRLDFTYKDQISTSLKFIKMDTGKNHVEAIYIFNWKCCQNQRFMLSSTCELLELQSFLTHHSIRIVHHSC